MSAKKFNRLLPILIAVLAVILAVLIGVVIFLGGQDSTPDPTDTTAALTDPPTDPPADPPTDPPTEPPTEPPTDPPVVDEELMPMGELRITSKNTIADEYSKATVSLKWEGGEIEEQTAQIRIRGYSSAMTGKKSYNIKFDSKVSAMGLDEGKKWTFLGTPYDKSLLRSVVGFEYAQRIGLDYTSEIRFVKVYLNNKYRGVYLMVEPIDIDPGRVEIDKDHDDFIIERNRSRTETGVRYITTKAGLRFEMSDPDEMTKEEANRYLAVLNEIEELIKTKDHTQYETRIDVQSFVDFYIFHELIKDIDFGRFSTRYYVEDGILHAGPVWDFDLSMGNISNEYSETVYKRYWNRDGQGNKSGDSTQGLWVNGDWYKWLCKDDYFMDLVQKRWQELRPVTENIFRDNELGKNAIDRYMEVYQDDFISNYSKDGANWALTYPITQLAYRKPAKTFPGNVEQLRTWLDQRMAWLDSQWGTGE